MKNSIRQLSYSYNEDDHKIALESCCNTIFTDLDKQELHEFLFALNEMDMICPCLYLEFKIAFEQTLV